MKTFYEVGAKNGKSSVQVDEIVWRISHGLSVQEEDLKLFVEYMSQYILTMKNSSLLSR